MVEYQSGFDKRASSGLEFHTKSIKNDFDFAGDFKDIPDELGKIKVSRSSKIIDAIEKNPDAFSEISLNFGKNVSISILGDNITPKNLVLYAITLKETVDNAKMKEKRNADVVKGKEQQKKTRKYAI